MTGNISSSSTNSSSNKKPRVMQQGYIISKTDRNKLERTRPVGSQLFIISLRAKLALFLVTCLFALLNSRQEQQKHRDRLGSSGQVPLSGGGFVGAALIQIHHNLGASPPGVREHELAPGELAGSATGGNTISGGHSTGEYRSPIKRIMEIISHHHSHHPVIVVSSSGSADSSADSQAPLPSQLQVSAQRDVPAGILVSPNPMLEALIAHTQQSQIAAAQQQQQQQQQQQHVASQHRQEAKLQDSQQQQQQQHQVQPLHQGPAQAGSQAHWAFVDTSAPDQILQQQQLIQSNVPYEQYYFSPAGPLTASPNGQLAILPASLNFGSPLAGQLAQQQQQLYHTSVERPQQASNGDQQQQMQTMTASSGTDKAQPIFLSSYVPDPNSMQQMQANQVLSMLNGQLGEPQQQVIQPQVQSQPQIGSINLAPNSIQQVQKSQQYSPPAQAETADATKPAQPKKVNENYNNSADEPTDDSDSKGSDESGPELADQGSSAGDESQTDSDDQQGQGPQRRQVRLDPDQSSGSISYEDKYDSDKDPSEPSGVERRKKKASAFDGNLKDGLVGVGLNENCLQCLCRASSGCDHSLLCITRGAEERVCGPFELTEEYWTKSGSVGENERSFNSFEECATDPDCAVETITGYMKNYGRDCDGDNKITCMDYARLHRLPPNECSDTDRLIKDGYWGKFQQCAESYNRSITGDVEDI